MGLVLFVGLAVVPPASGHFDVGTKVRQMVLTETDNTTEVYVRTPIPLLFGDILGGAVDEHGFLVDHGGVGEPLLSLSITQVQASRAAFATRLTNSLEWSVGPREVAARVRAYRILRSEPELRWSTSAAARASLREASASGDVAIGVGYVDFLVSVAAVPDGWPLSVRSGFAPVALPDGVQVDNHIVDERSVPRREYTRPGQLSRVLALPRSFSGWMVEYVFQGILHILAGADHVLLVVAMTLGASGSRELIRPITAFTFGHAITLTGGFLGYAPQAPWFIPLVESAIAASIVFAAVASLSTRRGSASLYAAVGLLHGFGFSFVLGAVLGRESPHLVPALSAFTVGIEIGQLAIVAVVFGVVFLVGKSAPGMERRLRHVALLGLVLIASYMLAARAPTIFVT